MDNVDLNLLPALDALLAEGSVTGAARRLGLSPSAMSRTLSRLRAVTGDPLLVRAGSGLVPTPRAVEMREQVRELARDARRVLTPQTAELDLAGLEQTFTIRSNDAFVELFAPALLAAVAEAAPRVRLRFTPKPVKDARPLREGSVDLEIGVLSAFAPEVRTQAMYRDKFVGAARVGHSLLSEPVTPERYAQCKHVVASRRSTFTGPVDDALEALGFRREIAAVVAGFPAAMRIARQSDLVALVPRACLDCAPPATGWLKEGLISFELPFPAPEIVVSSMWHPRMDADPAHRWLRGTLMAVCRAAMAPRQSC
jgi:DNA-binding transcriptional LysR family regulator